MRMETNQPALAGIDARLLGRFSLPAFGRAVPPTEVVLPECALGKGQVPKGDFLPRRGDNHVGKAKLDVFGPIAELKAVTD